MLKHLLIIVFTSLQARLTYSVHSVQYKYFLNMSPKSAKKIKNRKPVRANEKISTYFKNLDKKSEPILDITTKSTLLEDIEGIIEATPEQKKSKRKYQTTLKCNRESESINTSDILDKITNLKHSQKAIPRIEKDAQPLSPETSFGKYPNKIPDMLVQSPPRKRSNNSYNKTTVVNLADLSKSDFEPIQSNKIKQKITHIASTSNSKVSIGKTPEKVNKRQIFNSTLIPMEAITAFNTQVTPEKQYTNTKGIGKSIYFTSGKKKTPSKASQGTQDQIGKSSNVKHCKVNVLQDFVIISPNQDNGRSPVVIRSPKKSGEKKQKSILIYISPQQSEISTVAQSVNEHTPVKEAAARNILDASSKVKVRLNFSNDLPNSLSDVENSSSKRNKIEDYSFDDSWDDTDIGKMDINFNLDLSESCHCKILEIDKSNAQRNVTILVQSTKSDKKSYCVLKDLWAYTLIEIGNILRITAIQTQDGWEVNQKNGLLILEPDTLVSTTAVVSSMFCKRKTALKERFYGFESNNKHMIVGTLVHSLFQSCLRHKAYSKQEIEKIINDLLKSKDTIVTLYFASLDIDAIEGELKEFIPRILSFMEQYLSKKRNSQTDAIPDNWKGSIDSIHDIEENIWSPELGLKGKVDVTVKTGLATMPLELKTGRATFSLEHQGQILFYIMMMKKLGYNVPSGFLLYLREGKFREILMNSRDSSHLINIRNELAYYMTRTVKVVKGADKELSVVAMEMPEPLNNRLQTCRKCEYNVICSTYLRAENKSDYYPSFKPFQEEVLSHLEQRHLDYFIKWNNMLELENSCRLNKKFIWEIFTVPAKERAKNGQCIRNVCVTNCVEDHRESFIQTFEKKYKEAVVNFLSSGIGEHSYVVVSSDKRPAIACGLVTNIDFESITIALDRNLLAHNSPSAIYHLDTYDSHSSSMFLQSALSLMLEATPAAQRLRSVVVDRRPTGLGPALSEDILKHGRAIFSRLDISQQGAILKALQATEYMLIKGMPGTGKTATIVALIQLLVKLNQSVLITSHTNLAVDNVCMRLLNYNVPVLRLGAHVKTHEKLRNYSEFALTDKLKNIQELHELYSKAKVVAVTCLGSKHPLLSKRKFDVCIVDESTQVIQCSLFRAILASKKFILVGDPDQLEPVVRSKEALTLGLAESLFQRLENNDSTALLNLNYRMNATITALANKLAYKGLLKIGNDTIANATLRIPNIESFRSKYSSKLWVMSALDASLSNAVTVIDTGPIWNKAKITWNASDEVTEKSSTPTNVNKVKISNQNPYETSVIVTLCIALLQGSVSSKNIGVIAPYQDQVTQLLQFLNPLDIDVSTIDRFQGQDKEVIFFSGTKSCKELFGSQHHILENIKRLTVAVTRSKHKLIIVGDIQTLKEFKPFQKLFAAISIENVMHLEQNKHGFTWESVINLDDIKL